MSKILIFFKRKGTLLFLGGFLAAVLIIFSGNKAVKVTNTDEFCASCHNVHPHATSSWKLSTHYDNKRGIVVHCVECHLPPEGLPKFTEKVKTGIRDVYGTLFKDVENLNWELKSSLEYAKHHTYKASCVSCHENLFPLGLTAEGEEAHLYYNENSEELRCLNCHIGVGHYSESTVHAKNIDFGVESVPDTIFEEPAHIDSFTNFEEQIPGTGIKFKMIAIQDGSFILGSDPDEDYAENDEYPQREVSISRFFMAETEVTWEQYLAFFSETGSEGRTEYSEDVDGITGPTPPWGVPDQGWGKGERPAITMTPFAAEVFCKWLSMKTGKKYRLPTEAEWEYAAKAGITGPYFFGGKVKDYSTGGFLNKIFKPDTATIGKYVIYKANSNGRTALPGSVEPNPFGLRHMLGNAAEYCKDRYQSEAYSLYPEGPLKDPGPITEGEEYVVRGGSFKSEASEVRANDRSYTRTDEWLKTDPQMPKSIWWYSDATHVGFRVVCEWPE